MDHNITTLNTEPGTMISENPVLLLDDFNNSVEALDRLLDNYENMATIVKLKKAGRISNAVVRLVGYENLQLVAALEAAPDGGGFLSKAIALLTKAWNVFIAFFSALFKRTKTRLVVIEQKLRKSKYADHKVSDVVKDGTDEQKKKTIYCFDNSKLAGATKYIIDSTRDTLEAIPPCFPLSNDKPEELEKKNAILDVIAYANQDRIFVAIDGTAVQLHYTTCASTKESCRIMETVIGELVSADVCQSTCVEVLNNSDEAIKILSPHISKLPDIINKFKKLKDGARTGLTKAYEGATLAMIGQAGSHLKALRTIGLWCDATIEMVASLDSVVIKIPPKDK